MRPLLFFAPPAMSCRLPALLVATLLAVAALPLAGCQQEQQSGQEEAGQGVESAQDASPAQQAVRQQYEAGTVEATLHQHGRGSQLEVVLVNPSGEEATNQESARAVGAVAQEAYGRALDTVRVAFEYSSQAGPAEVGFHRRYAFASSALDTAATVADSGAAPPDTTAAGPDTTAMPQP